MKLWWMRTDAFVETPESLAILSDDERSQHRRYLSLDKRREYLVTRVLVRTLLGRELGVHPASVRFTCNTWGRPELAQPGPRFSLSHSGELVVCLVSSQCEPGVDTEPFSRAPSCLSLAPKVFAPSELEGVRGLPGDQQLRRALTIWTLKESYIKARGMGLALPLERIAFRLEGGQVRLELDPSLGDDASRWRFELFDLGTHLVATSCTCQDRIELAQAHLPL